MRWWKVLHKFNFYKVTSILKSSNIVSKIEIQNVDEIKGRGVYKIWCNLIPSRYKLQLIFIQTEKEIIYSYQVFTDKPIVRWDNAPHYPKIKTHPHLKQKDPLHCYERWIKKGKICADTEPEHWRNLYRPAGHYWKSSALSANRNSKDAGRLRSNKNTVSLKILDRINRIILFPAYWLKDFKSCISC